MTAQITDRIEIDGITYSLVGIDGYKLFEPADHELKVVMLHTACWRGFHVLYRIDNGQLLISSVTVGLDDEDRAAVEAGGGPGLFGKLPNKQESGYLYEGLDAPVSFTGGLLVADKFIQQLYVHMGFHPAWKYEIVKEIVLEKGKVVEMSDRSQAMAQFRRRYENHPLSPDPTDQAIVESFISRTFARKYTRS